MPEPPPVEEAVVLDEEAIRLFHWRVRALLRLGFNLRQARALADLQADWRAAEQLLTRGCPIDIAFDLLS